jgi:hypothetical protein
MTYHKVVYKGYADGMNYGNVIALVSLLHNTGSIVRKCFA